MSGRRYLRFLWSHEAAMHRLIARTYYRAVRRLPFALKYGIGERIRRSRIPYRLVEPGATVVQVGAPRDTVVGGRSRAMFFTRFAGSGGRVIVIEPDPSSAAFLREICERRNLPQVVVIDKAAWKEASTLTILVDDAHPASNFTAGAKQYDTRRMMDYRQVAVPADTLDAILADLGVNRVDLLSITTNGVEREILDGARETIRRGIGWISLAHTGSVPDGLMERLGYDLLAFDDRGRTYRRIAGRYGNGC